MAMFGLKEGIKSMKVLLDAHNPHISDSIKAGLDEISSVWQCSDDEKSK